MFLSTMSPLCKEGTVSSSTRVHDLNILNPIFSAIPPQQQKKAKKRRNLPGNPDPDAEVIALSPETLQTTNRFVCEICNKGFQRDQNLQLHKRGHNLPWKLRQRNRGEAMRKRVYVCPEPSCVHHHPSRALGDLTGIKKHFCRKHGEKKWKCDKCSRRYAVQSDWKAHSKTCGTREYRCDCGTLFSRKDSFVTHRAFCDALAEESARLSYGTTLPLTTTPTSKTIPTSTLTSDYSTQPLSSLLSPIFHASNYSTNSILPFAWDSNLCTPPPPPPQNSQLNSLSSSPSSPIPLAKKSQDSDTWSKCSRGMTRDFLGLAGEEAEAAAGEKLPCSIMVEMAAPHFTFQKAGPTFYSTAFGFHSPTWTDC